MNKRANLIYGASSSPQKQLYIENEFKKRQRKRLGRDPSPSADASDNSDNMYATILSSPEFANILMNLLAQKGLDVGDTETSAQLVELLKSNPDFVRGFLPAAPEQDEVKQEETKQEETIEFSIVPSENYAQQMDSFEGLDSSRLEPSSLPAQQEVISVDSANISMEISAPAPYSIPPPAPIPRLGVKGATEESSSPQQASTTPVPQPKVSPIPMPGYKPQIVSSHVQPRPSQERVKALGFPPMAGQPARS